MLLFARDLRETGEIRDDLTDEEVAHLVWMTNSPEFYQLATSGGRSPTDYARQALDLWTRTLIADPGRTGPRWASPRVSTLRTARARDLPI